MNDYTMNDYTMNDYTMTNSNRLLDALRAAGHRITGQRRILCNYLAKTHSHPTASAVYAALAPAHPELSRATVYNTLNILHQLGAIIQIDLGDDHTHYETNLQPHVNLICRRCGRVTDIASPLPLVEILESVQVEEFHAATVQIQVLGLCVDCQAQEI
jgi:Fur family peroxide stress response transcriptional regulator